MPRECRCDNCEYRTTGPDRDCKYGSRCKNANCWSAHPSPAGGRSTAGKNASACRFGINCHQGNCEFAHPSPARKCCEEARASSRGGGAMPEQSLVRTFAGMSLDSSASRAQRNLLGKVVNTRKKFEAIQEHLDSIAGLRQAGFRPETVDASLLSIAHAVFMGDFFLPAGCWTGNFSTSILEAKAKLIIDEEQVEVLLGFNRAFNQQARHPPPAEPPAPDLSKSHQEWQRSSEYKQYFGKWGGGVAERGQGSRT